MRAWALVVVCIGCGGRAATIDAAVDGPEFVPGPNVVTMRAADATSIVYRDGDGPWTSLDPVESGTYQLHITDAYEVAVTCGDDLSFDSEYLARTFGDGADLSVPCYAPTLFKPLEHQVLGDMMQAGFVDMWDRKESTVGPWSFEITVPTGTYDLIAVGADARMAVRRDIAVSADTALPAIDVDVEGAPTVSVPMLVTGVADDDTFDAVTFFATGHGGIWLDGTRTALAMPPPELVQASDEVWAQVTAEQPPYDRWISDRGAIAGIASYTLLPRLAPVTYTIGHNLYLYAAWTDELPPATEVQLDLVGFGYGWASQTATATRAWLATKGVKRLAFDAPIPTNRLVNLSGAYVRTFSIVDASDTQVRVSSLGEDRNFLAAHRTRVDRDRRRAVSRAALARHR